MDGFAYKYTSTALFAWASNVLWWKKCFIIVPIALGAVAVSPLFLEMGETGKVITSISAFMAGLFPLIYGALEFDAKIGWLSWKGSW